MPIFSIIVPVYNVEKFLRECLDSILIQTLKDFELICINDGSTDASLEILNEYAENNRIVEGDFYYLFNNDGTYVNIKCAI